MPRSDDLYSLPAGLPVPVDDGACGHLPEMPFPAIPVPSTAREPLPGWNEVARWLRERGA